MIIVTETAKRHFHNLRPEEGDDQEQASREREGEGGAAKSGAIPGSSM